MSEYDAVDEGPFCAFKDYHRRGAKRPGQWTCGPRGPGRRSIKEQPLRLVDQETT